MAPLKHERGLCVLYVPARVPGNVGVDRAMVLNHGAISFPVGTPLDVVDFQRLIPNATSPRLSATVVDNNRSGIQLAW